MVWDGLKGITVGVFLLRVLFLLVFRRSLGLEIKVLCLFTWLLNEAILPWVRWNLASLRSCRKWHIYSTFHILEMRVNSPISYHFSWVFPHLSVKILHASEINCAPRCISTHNQSILAILVYCVMFKHCLVLILLIDLVPHLPVFLCVSHLHLQLLHLRALSRLYEPLKPIHPRIIDESDRFGLLIPICVNQAIPFPLCILSLGKVKPVVRILLPSRGCFQSILPLKV